MEILAELRRAGQLDDGFLAKAVHRHNRQLRDNRQHYAKKKLLPYYLRIKTGDPGRWASWDVSPALERQLVQALRVKPRRTASGVATITVITKPWKCGSDCLYCPSDLRMPKSYLSDEPACQRAERNFFDPYLQVASRLRALTQMGHATDKIELIILGGTWTDYPLDYQIWFVSELFRALNAGDGIELDAQARRGFYREKGLSSLEASLADGVWELQKAVDDGRLSYNQAVAQLYLDNEAWSSVAALQTASFDILANEHAINEDAEHRVVGLAVETRPDAITAERLTLLRRLGCTKLQIGIQSLDPRVLELNNRRVGPASLGVGPALLGAGPLDSSPLERIRESFELLRVFGFKIHAHFMLNLYGSSPEADKRDYRRLVGDATYLPDEVKLYPCALVKGTGLCRYYAEQSWLPYSEEELLDVLVDNTLATPPFVRISRMIRDISAEDIVAGNKKANLRQLVEGRIEQAAKAGHLAKAGQDEPAGRPDLAGRMASAGQAQAGQAIPVTREIQEIRYREISTSDTDITRLRLDTLTYQTSVSDELFLQWLTAENRIAAFLRLSLPHRDYLRQYQDKLPVAEGEAMIREVHVYGKVAKLHSADEGAQHLGLGKQLIEHACELAAQRGYRRINVISSVGTRNYYRSLGFQDNGLYQQMSLEKACDSSSGISAKS